MPRGRKRRLTPYVPQPWIASSSDDGDNENVPVAQGVEHPVHDPLLRQQADQDQDGPNPEVAAVQVDPLPHHQHPLDHGDEDVQMEIYLGIFFNFLFHKFLLIFLLRALKF